MLWSPALQAVSCCAQVTNENKREYVDLVAEHRMTTAIRAQTQSYLKGYWEMVPKVPPPPDPSGPPYPGASTASDSACSCEGVSKHRPRNQ